MPAVALATLALCVAVLPLAGCRKAAPAAEPPAASDEEKASPAAEGVALKPEEIARAGVVTTPAPAAKHAPESAGYAVIVTRETIAQAVADLTTATAVERQSRAALERGRQLAGTPGAMPIESQDAAVRQATVDHAARLLAQRRLAATFGSNAPWHENYASPVLAALASGESRLARVTFPLGALGAANPATLRLSHLGEAAGGKSIESHSVWGAPADASIPGKSFFALLSGSEAAEGERLLARAPVGATEAGVVVPFAAAVISAGKSGGYVEAKPGLFVRTEIDTSMAVDTGYFVKAGIAPGARIVTSSAGQLLARESNPGGAAD
ncbi:MAG: hypothetical protein PVS2B3_11070 [Steroidobacteraceae bacterium]